MKTDDRQPAPTIRSTLPRRPGRTVIELPAHCALQVLRLARIVGTATSGPVLADTGECETALVCLEGLAFLLVAGELYEMSPYDTLYVPRGKQVRVDADGIGCHLAEFAAPSEGQLPVQFVSYHDALEDPALQCEDSTLLIGPNVRTERIATGIAHAASAGLQDAAGFGAPCEQAHLFLSGNGQAPDSPGATICDDYMLLPEGVLLPMSSPARRLDRLWVTAAIGRRRYSVGDRIQETPANERPCRL